MPEIWGIYRIIYNWEWVKPDGRVLKYGNKLGIFQMLSRNGSKHWLCEF